jgi:BirA family transcriptional regulator, biotin operon repressor / biotin---[acetyl-CoA-carboxylase] ligase
LQLSDIQKSILSLLADGRFHSGNELAKNLHISRPAVWKNLQQLAEIGIAYVAVTGKGYRLEKPLALLSSDAILSLLTDNAQNLLGKLEIHDSLTSTNTHLGHSARDGALSGTVCFAEQQSAGKGRRGRQWVSPYGYNIYMSALWRFPGGPASVAGLSLAAGVAVIRALNACFPNSYSLKWPNDIHHRQKKLGGILIEVNGESEGPCAAIIGIGLNVYLPPAAAASIDQPWIDLTQLEPSAGAQRNELAAALLNHLLLVLSEFQDKGIAGFIDEWRCYDGLSGQMGTLFIGQHQIDGRIRGIDDQGLLLMERPDGTVQAFASGEVSFRPQKT